MSKKGMRYTVNIVSGAANLNEREHNVDVEVVFQDGSRHSATFFTIENLKYLLDSYKASGECKNGLYVWAADMVIVRELSIKSIHLTIADLISKSEFEDAFSGPYSDDNGN